jgi:hypothetical protein
MFNRALTIKSDVNGLLDIARATFCEYVDLLEEYVQVIHSNYGTRKPYSKDDHRTVKTTTFLLSYELAPYS